MKTTSSRVIRSATPPTVAWFEGPERRYPDQLTVVATPEGGLDGSEYALIMRTRNSGIPGEFPMTCSKTI